MHTTINPRRFFGRDIVLTPLSRGQSAVTLDGLRIGRISHAPDVKAREAWLWSLTGPSCDSMPPSTVMLGEAATLSEAKLKLRAAFDEWLSWAVGQGESVRWHWLEAAPTSSREATVTGKSEAA